MSICDHRRGLGELCGEVKLPKPLNPITTSLFRVLCFYAHFLFFCMQSSLLKFHFSVKSCSFSFPTPMNFCRCVAFLEGDKLQEIKIGFQDNLRSLQSTSFEVQMRTIHDSQSLLKMPSLALPMDIVKF